MSELTEDEWIDAAVRIVRDHGGVEVRPSTMGRVWDRLVAAQTRALEQERDKWRARFDQQLERARKADAEWRHCLKLAIDTDVRAEAAEKERDEYLDLLSACPQGVEGHACCDCPTPAEQRVAELEAAVLALHRPDGGVAGPGAMCVECTFNFGTPHEEPVAYPCATVRLVSDPTVLDLVRQEAVEAALALIEEVLSRQEEWARASVLDISGRVGEERRTSGKATLMNIEEVRTALAIAREATAR